MQLQITKRGVSTASVNYLSETHIQSNLNGSNTDGSFTMANSNSFLSPYEILLIAQENKYLGKFSYFNINLYAECTHQNRLWGDSNEYTQHTTIV